MESRVGKDGHWMLELATLCDVLMMMVLLRTTTLFRVGEDVRTPSQDLCDRVVAGTPMCDERPC